MGILTKDFLEEQYLNCGKSIREIAEFTGINTTTIGRRLNKFQIPKREGGTRKGKPNKKVNTMKWNISQNQFIEWCKIITKNN